MAGWWRLQELGKRRRGEIGSTAKRACLLQLGMAFLMLDFMATHRSGTSPWLVLWALIWCVVLPTLGVFFALRRAAKEKAYHGAWGLFALLNLVGALVVGALPNRDPDGVRGFPLDGAQQAEDHKRP